MKRFSFRLKLYFFFVISLYLSVIAGSLYFLKPHSSVAKGEISEQAVIDDTRNSKKESKNLSDETEPWIYTRADTDFNGLDRATFRLAYGIKQLESSDFALRFKAKFPNNKDAAEDVLPREYYKSMVTVLGYQGHGSGFVFNVDNSGRALIMTNAHVIDQDSPTFAVLTYEGELLKVHNYDMDLARDLAVLEVYSNKLKAFPVALDKAVKFDNIMTIGSPGTSINTINLGKVINKGEKISIDYGTGKKRFLEFTQVDAKVEEGNSGGPVLNKKGEVVGVVCCVYKYKTMSGFIDYRNMIFRMKDYIDNGYFTRAYLGLKVELREKNTAFGIKKDGYLIKNLDDNEGVFGFDLKIGDIITSINGIPTPMDKKNSEYLLQIMNDALGNGDPLVLEVLRNKDGEYKSELKVLRLR